MGGKKLASIKTSKCRDFKKEKKNVLKGKRGKRTPGQGLEASQSETNPRKPYKTSQKNRLPASERGTGPLTTYAPRAFNDEKKQKTVESSDEDRLKRKKSEKKHGEDPQLG